MCHTQAGKSDEAQQRLVEALPSHDATSGVAAAVVVGCGPAGLALAAELARRDVQVVLIGALLQISHTHRTAGRALQVHGVRVPFVTCSSSRLDGPAYTCRMLRTL